MMMGSLPLSGCAVRGLDGPTMRALLRTLLYVYYLVRHRQSWLHFWRAAWHGRGAHPRGRETRTPLSGKKVSECVGVWVSG